MSEKKMTIIINTENIELSEEFPLKDYADERENVRYAIRWLLIGYSKAERKEILQGLDSIE